MGKRRTRFGDESHLGLVRRARRMNRTLARAFPNVYCELDFTDPLELTVATILSAVVTILAGMNQGLEYAELPFFVDVMVTVA